MSKIKSGQNTPYIIIWIFLPYEATGRFSWLLLPYLSASKLRNPSYPRYTPLVLRKKRPKKPRSADECINLSNHAVILSTPHFAQCRSCWVGHVYLVGSADAFCCCCFFQCHAVQVLRIELFQVVMPAQSNRFSSWFSGMDRARWCHWGKRRWLVR